MVRMHVQNVLRALESSYLTRESASVRMSPADPLRRKVESNDAATLLVTMESFTELRQAAIDAQNRGDCRLMADKAREALEVAPNKWTSGRYCMLTYLNKAFCMDGVRPTEKDLEMLDTIANDEEEPVMFRVEAFFGLGQLKRGLCEDEEAAEIFRQCLDLLAKEDSSYKPYTIHLYHDGAHQEKPVAQILEGMVMMSNAWLSELERPAEGDIPGFEHIQQRFVVGGSKCDCCGKNRRKVYGGLLRCSRCRLAYYCSPQCQKRQWLAGHKKCCRKPDDIKEGDMMKLKGLVNRSELNGYICSVLRAAAAAPGGRWEVQTIAPAPIVVSVAAKNLSHLRPQK